MPFLNVIGVISISSTFNITFRLVNKEDQESYNQALERLKDLRSIVTTNEPHVVIIDFEKALKNALKNVWLDTQQQICLWYINKNVVFKVKKRQKWPPGITPPNEAPKVDKTDDYMDPIFRDLVTTAIGEQPSSLIGRLPIKVLDNPNSFLKLQKYLYYTITKEDLKATWVRILKDFLHQEAIIEYIQGTYLPVRRQWAGCYIRHYRNFGIKVISYTKGSHKEIKSYLRNSYVDLLFLTD